MSAPILRLTTLQILVFLVNSRLGLFSATVFLRHSFSRSYGVILPSSLTMVLPRVLEFSSCLPVSVLVRVQLVSIASFLGSRASGTSLLKFRSPSGLSIILRICLQDLPTPLDVLFLSYAFPSFLRQHFSQTTTYSTGISTCCPSPTPFGLSLGPDLP